MQAQIAPKQAGFSHEVCPICPQKSILWSYPLGLPVTLVYCDACSKAYCLPKNYRPSYQRYARMVQQANAYMENARYLQEQHAVALDALLASPISERPKHRKEMRRISNISAIVDRSDYIGDISHDKYDFEWYIWDRYTSVNTPLPKLFMEFFNHDD